MTKWRRGIAVVIPVVTFMVAIMVLVILEVRYGVP